MKQLGLLTCGDGGVVYSKESLMNCCKHCGTKVTHVNGQSYPVVGGSCLNCKELEASLGETVFNQMVELATRIADNRIDDRKYEISED
jgi:hypothetical protein